MTIMVIKTIIWFILYNHHLERRWQWYEAHRSYRSITSFLGYNFLIARERNRTAINLSTETQHKLNDVQAVEWIHKICLITVLLYEDSEKYPAIIKGSTTSPAKSPPREARLRNGWKLFVKTCFQPTTIQRFFQQQQQSQTSRTTLIKRCMLHG